MNTQTARKILLLYRPGTADSNEPEFAEALDCTRQDETLRRWFEDQCATQEVIRSRFKLIRVPEALREQIISERPWRPVVVSKREVFALAGFVVAVVFACFALLWSRPSSDDNNLAAFQQRMASTVLRSYPAMDLVTNDLNQIQAYLMQYVKNGNYILPPGLNKAKAVGCLVTSWRGRDVAMICFKSGQPMAAGQSSDVWLFVTDQDAVSDAPPTGTPQLGTVSRLNTASWTEGGKTYLLAVDGDEKMLKQYF